MNVHSLQSAFSRVVIYPSRSLRFASDWDRGEPDRANCYAYALNRPELGHRTPGDLNKERGAWLYSPPSQQAQEWVHKALLTDGLEAIAPAEVAMEKGHIIAAFGLKYFFDFHFYRLDQNKTWSHKDRISGPYNHDGNGNPITDPVAHGESLGFAFAGFYKVPAKGIPGIVYP